MKKMFSKFTKEDASRATNSGTPNHGFSGSGISVIKEQPYLLKLNVQDSDRVKLDLTSEKNEYTPGIDTSFLNKFLQVLNLGNFETQFLSIVKQEHSAISDNNFLISANIRRVRSVEDFASDERIKTNKPKLNKQESPKRRI